jgi:hypothetical protein
MPDLLSSEVLNPRPGWYRGDLHAHTNASDGIYPASMLVELARAEGLDFLAITDHNSIQALSELREGPSLLIVPGLEVTLDHGDFNVFGVCDRSDWMEQICAGQMRIPLQGRYATTTDLMRRTEAAGLLNSINHPLLSPWEWRYGTTDLRYVHCLEVCNDPYYPDNARANPQAVALWTAWLNAGYRMTAVGGSDYHYPPRPAERDPGMRLGLPSTYVLAKELSVPAIVEGLREGRAYVSVGPQVMFQARAGSTVYDIGGDLGQLSGEIEITAGVAAGHSAACAQIVKNGQVVAEKVMGEDHDSLAIRTAADAASSDWYRLDVLDRSGQLLAITNPIFVGPARVPRFHKYSDFVDLTDGGQVVQPGRSKPSRKLQASGKVRGQL